MDPLAFGMAAPSGVEVLLGIDGGGPTTQAVVADLTGRILGRGLGPVSNHRRVGFDAATKAHS